jgi:NAD(P)-dependent dehydrogenase (short-subunit alcohol dehydrogenase family)
MSLSASKVVVTGGGSGIGFATAKLAVDRGASVVLMGRTEARLKEAAEKLGDTVSYEVLDVTDGDAVERAFASVGTFDHLVTCAAGTLSGPFIELAELDVRGFFETKFWGQYRSVKAALPRLARDGSVVLLSGFLYRKAEPGLSPFAAVNGAIEALVKVLAIEAAPVRVNALAPGQIDTLGGGEPMDEATRRAYLESVAAQLPLGRIGTAEEAAHAALFLVENTFTTGITLDVDGGKR